MHSFTFSSDSDSLRQLTTTVRKFAENTLSTKPEPLFSRSEFDALAALGLTAASVPEAIGGAELSALDTASIPFELSRQELGPAIYLSVHLMVAKLIAHWDSRKSHGAAIQALSSGAALGAFCLTEARAGSDASSLELRAEADGDSFVLNGEKIYITSAGEADLYLVFARTSPLENQAEKSKGISAFVVAKETPGLSFGKPEKKMGCEGAPIANVTFNACRLPKEALLGELGQGYKIALSGLAAGRVSIAAAACGLASRALEISSGYLQERKQFGQALIEFQGLQFMLADMATKLLASILLTRHAAIELDQGNKNASPSSMAKCFATDAAMEICTDAVQLLGGAGYLREYKVEQLMRDAKMLQIVEGTNQIQRILIAREL